MRVLELFAGTASFSAAARALGHETFTVEMNPDFKSDYCVDVMEIDLSRLPWRPDVVWASPPCTYFSVMSIGKNWDHGWVPKTENARLAKEIVKKTVAVIEELRPSFWFVENPVGMLRKLHLIPGTRRTVTYCQYGERRRKPTDIWTNSGVWVPRPACSNRDKCHDFSPAGSRQGTQAIGSSKDRARVPAELCTEILKSCEKPNKKTGFLY